MADQSTRPSLGKRRLRRASCRVLLIGMLVVSAFLTTTPLGRAATRAALLETAVIQAGLSSAPRTNDPDVRHTAFTVPSQSGDVYLDLYESRAGPAPIPGSRPGILLISGVGDNRPIPQLINLADDFARAGIVLETMTTDNLLAFQLAASDADAVVQAFDALARHPGVNPHAISLVGLSAGGSVLCLGAEDERIRDRIASLTMFGSYSDAKSLLQDIGRRALLDHGKRISWQPDPVPVSVLANTVADLLPAGEGDTISQEFAGALTPIPSDVLNTLSPVTQAVYHLLAGDQPDQVATNINRLTPAIVDRLTALSPRARLADLHAPVYLLHDRHDPFVPYTESQDFATALGQAHHPYDYATFDIFAHVEVRAGTNPLSMLGDGAQLYRILCELLLVGA